MGALDGSRVQAQLECVSNQKQIYTYPGEDQKKQVFAVNWFVYVEFAPNSGEEQKKKKGLCRHLVLTSA